MIIKYTQWGTHLRLGNWLFLYAGIQSILKESDNQLCLPDSYFLWKYLENPPTLITSEDYDEIFHFRQLLYIPEEKQYLVDFFREKRDVTVNINLGCHLQSEKWFEEDKEYIKGKLKIKDEEINKVREKYKEFFTKPTIGFGIRRGDFVGHGDFYQVPETWYEDALRAHFPNWEDYNIVIFSDDIGWCKQYYQGTGYFFADANGTHTHEDNFKHYHKDPMEQFILGTQMSNFIGGNSTFSWWQSWYVKNMNRGTVIHCGENLSERGKGGHGDNPFFYPADWTLHKI